MDASHIRRILEDIVGGRLSVDDAMERLRDLPFSDLGVIKHDNHRCLRNGFSEVVFCQGKRKEHLLSMVGEIAGKGSNVFGTRADEDTLEAIGKAFPKAECDALSRTFRIINGAIDPVPGRLSILCAGTADVTVAEEARRTAEFFGLEAARHYDVGVAGLHRVLSCIDELRGADCAIVIAGMEGALPSVVGGLVSVPIIGVPTSIGYGANFGGIAALLAMLNSCSEGISIVNIDNGFGAACAALRIIKGMRGKV